jgi:hypothetical protein
MIRVAFCMAGEINTTPNSFPGQKRHEKQHYMKMCFNSIYKHIVSKNIKNYKVDFFCHSWNPELNDFIKAIYKPVLCVSEKKPATYALDSASHNTCAFYEGVDLYSPNQALSVKRVIELKEQHEKTSNVSYDIVFIYRYDILLWKNINLSEYRDLDDKIYTNWDDISHSFVYFVFNKRHASHYKYIYDYITLKKTVYNSKGNSEFIRLARLELACDPNEIHLEKNCEIIEKVFEKSLFKRYIDINKFYSYK